MKKLLLIATLALSLAASAQYQDVRERKVGDNRPLAEFVNQHDVLFNDGWKFQLVTKDNKTTDFASPQLDDSQWRTLDLPHDFQFEQPWTEGGGGARGFKPSCEGWYRKTFTVPEYWQGLNVKLDFGGIIYLGDVYINGTKVASTDYGYVGLEADLTKHLKYGGENVVAVYASTGPKKGSRWYTGAGLFRDVRLQLENPTHIARHGVYITCEVDELTGKQVDELSASGVRSEELGIRSEELGIRSSGVQKFRSADNSMTNNPSSNSSSIVAPPLEGVGRFLSTRQLVNSSTNNLIYLNITATDSKGRIVPEYNEPLTATVEGGATLYALDNHDHYTSELFHNVNTKNMKNGRMQVILRRSNKPGKIVLKVATPSFKKKITIL
ncbi:MAG: hypothetical protein IJE12_09480 [Prevotella sp.]|nr:hypothetical protein [Prevotella sp.]